MAHAGTAAQAHVVPGPYAQGVGGEEWANTGQDERESGSGGRIRTYDMAVNSRPLYH
jgi:hypothetical protein